MHSFSLQETGAGCKLCLASETRRGDAPMIKKALSFIFVLAAAAVAVGQQPTPTPAKATPPAAPHTNLKVGDKAPDFTLASTATGQDGRSLRFKLSDFKGKKNVVLAFYVLAFTGG
ncbi:MAG TPA: hypothetical protein VHD88_00270 [Pyrinomonadaceae bacterium]|nr:hypothetical protein [Pyrinomonadaceae bacterium]